MDKKTKQNRTENNTYSEKKTETQQNHEEHNC